MTSFKKRFDPWLILLLAALGFWWLLAGSYTTPAGQIRALENSTNPQLWLMALGSEDRSVRDYARANVIDALPPDSLASIAREAIENPDPANRLAGLWLLSRINDPGSGELAIRFLGDDDPETRVAALEVLATDPVPEAHDTLIELTKDPDTPVQIAALNALSQLQQPDDLSVFVGFLGKSDARLRDTAGQGILLLAPYSPDVLPTLFATGYGPDLPAARQALGLIGDIGGDEALDGLLTFLGNGPIGLLSEAADAIGRVGGDEAGIRVLEIYRTSDSRVRAQAARALGVLKVTEARTDLWSAVRDETEDLWVRFYSLEALSNCGDEELVSGIVEFIAVPNRDPRLVRMGIEALGGIGGERVIELYDEIIAGEIDFGFSRAGGQTALISAIRGLGRMDSDESRDRLRTLLDSADPDSFEILIDLVRSLEKVGNEDDIEILTELADSELILRGPASEAVQAIERRLSPDTTETE